MSKETKLQIVIDARNRAEAALGSLKKDLDQVAAANENIIGVMKGVGKVGAVAFAGLSFMTKGIVEAGAGFEQTQIAFETMIGSAEEAEKTLKALSQFAARTPFGLNQLEEASKRLLAYGIEVDNLIPTLRMLGDISAGVGMDKLPQLILAFGQVRAATKLTGMELRQFSEAGVPLLGTLAQQLGKTEAEIMEMVSAGEIGFPLVEEALASLTGEGGKFFNLMERQSTSLGGMWSNLNDQISLTARTIGEQLLPYLKPVIDRLISITQVVGEFVKQNPAFSTGILIAALAISGLLAVLFPLAVMLPGLIVLWGMLTAGFAAVTAASAPMVVAIGAVVAILGVLAANGYLTKEAWVNVWTGIKIIAAESANSVVDTVESMVNFIISGVNKAIEAINKVIRAAQKVPGIGSKLSTIKSLQSVDFGSIDTSSFAGGQSIPAPATATKAPLSIYVTGNSFLDQYGAERVGDLILARLKLSNPI